MADDHSRGDAPMELRALTLTDIPELAALLGRAFERWPRAEFATDPVEHLRWKMSSDPLAPSACRVVVQSGRILAAGPFWLTPMLIGGKKHVGMTGVDHCVDPAFRNRGIYARVVGGDMRFALQFAQTASPAVEAAWVHELGGKRVAASLEVLAHPLRRGAERPAVLVRSAWKRMRRRKPPRTPAAGWTVRRASNFAADVEQLFRDAASAFDFVTVRTRERMNWRYCDPRGGEFELREARDAAGSLGGYAVLAERGRRGYVADLLVAPGGEEQLRALLDDAVTVFLSRGVDTVRTWMARRHPYRRATESAGFVPVGRRINLMYNRLSAAPEDLAPLDDPAAIIHVVPGDMDLI